MQARVQPTTIVTLSCKTGLLGARFPNSRRQNRLCRFKFLEATGMIIWKHSSDHLGRSLRQKRSVVRDRLEFYPCDRDDRKRLSSDRFLMETGFKRQNRQKRWDISRALALDCLLHFHIRALKWRQGTRITPLHLLKKQSDTNVFITNCRRIIRKEEPEKTSGQKFGLTAEAVPKTDAFFDVLFSSSSQNIPKVFFFD